MMSYGRVAQYFRGNDVLPASNNPLPDTYHPYDFKKYIAWILITSKPIMIYKYVFRIVKI